MCVLPRDGGARLGRDSQLRVGRDSELYRILNMHYNKSNVYQVRSSIKSNIIVKLNAFQNVCVETLCQYLETCWTIGRKGCNAQCTQSVRWQGAARGQLHCCERILSWMTLILIDSIRPLSHRFRFPQRHDSEKQSKISSVQQVSSFCRNCFVNGVRVQNQEIIIGWFGV